MGNPVVRWQIISPAPDASAGFYRQLFGWTVTQDNALGYREVKTNAPGGIDGGVWPAPPQSPPFLHFFVEVPDIDACIAQATALGATVLVPTSALPDGDAMAVLQDSVGMAFAVCTLGRREV